MEVPWQISVEGRRTTDKKKNGDIAIERELAMVRFLSGRFITVCVLWSVFLYYSAFHEGIDGFVQYSLQIWPCTNTILFIQDDAPFTPRKDSALMCPVQIKKQSHMDGDVFCLCVASGASDRIQLTLSTWYWFRWCKYGIWTDRSWRIYVSLYR